MFTGSIIEDRGIFHAFYTSWNPNNPAGREFVCHATSKDLVSWTKHPNDMFGPDGIHYAHHRDRDFRDPCVVWDAEQKQFVMYCLIRWIDYRVPSPRPSPIRWERVPAGRVRAMVYSIPRTPQYVNANPPGRGGFVFGRLTSQDLKQWQQLPAIENIPGDECPDFFQAGGTYYLHGCNVYAFAKDENGPWKFPSYNRVDRRMAAKRVFDGKRHVWFGGWLNGPVSIPREVYEGPNGLLFLKPVPEVVNAFSEVALTVSDLSLTADTPWQKAAPRDYLLEATMDLSKGRELALGVRGEGKDVVRIVLSAGKKMLETPGFGQPLPIDFTRPVTLQAFIVGGVAELFVNSQVAATWFISPVGGTLSMDSQGTVVVQSLQVKTRGTRDPLKQ